LGLEAQRKTVEDYLNGGHWKLVREYVEVDSGKKDDRPVLAEAIKACRQYGAKLVIAKIDRLSRDAHFLLGLEKAGIDFVAADMPNTNRLTVGIMAMVAQGRTSHDLRANQGGATSLRAIAGGQNERGVPTPRGGIWSAAQVMRVLARGPASSGPFDLSAAA